MSILEEFDFKRTDEFDFSLYYPLERLLKPKPYLHIKRDLLSVRNYSVRDSFRRNFGENRRVISMCYQFGEIKIYISLGNKYFELPSVFPFEIFIAFCRVHKNSYSTAGYCDLVDSPLPRMELYLILLQHYNLLRTDRALFFLLSAVVLQCTRFPRKPRDIRLICSAHISALKEEVELIQVE